MKTDNLTSETLRRYIPNVFAEVEGETPLADKLAPFIDSARVWLETEYLGPDDFLSDAHNDFALRLLVAKAVADAVPSLDLVVTPTGMAVVNTDTLAPASKDRVERLISSLLERVRKGIPVLLDLCRTYESWRLSERGRYFGASFISSPRDCEGLDISFEEARRRAILVEGAMADRYLGRTMLDTLRDDYNSGAVTRGNSLVNLLIATLTNIIPAPDYERVFDQNALWHAACPVLNELPRHAKYIQLWEAEMGDRFKSFGFVNDIKGGYYF